MTVEGEVNFLCDFLSLNYHCPHTGESRSQMKVTGFEEKEKNPQTHLPNQGFEAGNLQQFKTIPHRFMYSNTWPPEGGAVWGKLWNL